MVFCLLPRKPWRIVEKVDTEASFSWTLEIYLLALSATYSKHQDLFLGIGHCFSQDVYASTDLVNWSARTCTCFNVSAVIGQL